MGLGKSAPTKSAIIQQAEIRRNVTIVMKSGRTVSLPATPQGTLGIPKLKSPEHK